MIFEDRSEQQKFPIHMAVFGYTLQFIQDLNIRKMLIRQVYERMAEGGMLFVMEKYKLRTHAMDEVAQDAYITFRRQNGYSLEEITRKTEALKNAMWPAEPEFMKGAMESAGFRTIEILYREFNFGGLVAIK